METEVLWWQTKIKVAHYIKTSHDAHIKLVKCFQKKKEDRNFSKPFLALLGDRFSYSCFFQ